MKKIFTSEFIGKIILEVIAIGIVVFLIQGYFNNKWQPLTAAETLKRENFLNAKRDAYYEAINILNRNLAYTQFTVDGKLADTANRNIGGSYPSDIEINNCFSKLCIYSDNSQIPLTYQKLFLNDSTTRPVLEMVTFIKLVRQDLGYGEAIIDTTGDRYKFIQTHRKN
jgi:hypothetical protein